MTDYKKLHDAQSIAWEWGQGVTDAETAIRKLHKLFPIDAEIAEPVAWIRFCSDGLYEGPIMNSVIGEIRKKSGAWTPLYTAPASGVRAGMLRAADICDVMARDGYTGTANDALAFASNLIMSEAITRAADQVNAEGHKPGCLADGECICFSAPHSASQPDTVAVPVQTLHVSLQVLTFLKAVLIGQGYQKDSSSIHQLEIAYSMLRAAQEAK